MTASHYRIGAIRTFDARTFFRICRRVPPSLQDDIPAHPTMDLAQTLSDAGPDAVCSACTHHKHHVQARAALAAGKPVVCEKPRLRSLWLGPQIRGFCCGNGWLCNGPVRATRNPSPAESTARARTATPATVADVITRRLQNRPGHPRPLLPLVRPHCFGRPRQTHAMVGQSHCQPRNPAGAKLGCQGAYRPERAATAPMAAPRRFLPDSAHGARCAMARQADGQIRGATQRTEGRSGQTRVNRPAMWCAALPPRPATARPADLPCARSCRWCAREQGRESVPH